MGRLAVRAGVSVGSLYQYYPNKLSLLPAVLEKHLIQIVEAVEVACVCARSNPVAEMAARLVHAFMVAKFAQPDASESLYAVASEVLGERVVARLTQRSQAAIIDMLATAADRRFVNLAPISFFLSTWVIGPVQALPASLVSVPLTHLVEQL